MRASSDSWRGSIDRSGGTEGGGGGGGNSNPTTTTNKKHQCLFAACVPAKECDPEEVKCVFFFQFCLLLLVINIYRATLSLARFLPLSLAFSRARQSENGWTIAKSRFPRRSGVDRRRLVSFLFDDFDDDSPQISSFFFPFVCCVLCVSMCEKTTENASRTRLSLYPRKRSSARYTQAEVLLARRRRIKCNTRNITTPRFFYTRTR